MVYLLYVVPQSKYTNKILIGLAENKQSKQWMCIVFLLSKNNLLDVTLCTISPWQARPQF